MVLYPLKNPNQKIHKKIPVDPSGGICSAGGFPTFSYSKNLILPLFPTQLPKRLHDSSLL